MHNALPGRKSFTKFKILHKKENLNNKLTYFNFNELQVGIARSQKVQNYYVNLPNILLHNEYGAYRRPPFCKVQFPASLLNTTAILLSHVDDNMIRN